MTAHLLISVNYLILRSSLVVHDTIAVMIRYNDFKVHELSWIIENLVINKIIESYHFQKDETFRCNDNHAMPSSETYMKQALEFCTDGLVSE